LEKKEEKNMKFSAKELKHKLWDTLIALEERKIDVRTANAIISSAREIVAIVRTELDILKLKGTTDTLKLLGE
jgi:hypothetical protein